MSAYAAAGHWVCLLFFPKAWSFICPTEIRAFNTRLEEFLYNRTCAVVFCSTDNEYSLRAWSNTSAMDGGLGSVHTPLLSDSSHSISKAYGVLDEARGVAQRGLFIIDPKGIVRAASMNDSDVGRSVDETIRLIDALAFRDTYGEGCPADWKKGDTGIKLAELTKVDGSIELVKKSWAGWARPKLGKAWSHSTSSQPPSPGVVSPIMASPVVASPSSAGFFS